MEAVLALSAREKYDTEKKTQRSLPQRLGPFVTIILRAQLHWEYLYQPPEWGEPEPVERAERICEVFFFFFGQDRGKKDVSVPPSLTALESPVVSEEDCAKLMSGLEASSAVGCAIRGKARRSRGRAEDRRGTWFDDWVKLAGSIPTVARSGAWKRIPVLARKHWRIVHRRGMRARLCRLELSTEPPPTSGGTRKEGRKASKFIR